MVQHRNSSFLPALPLLLLAATLAVGCKNGQAAPRPAPTAVKVESAVVAARETPIMLRLTGTLRGAQETDLAANVSGRITSTLVERGSRVKAGDIIARVDTKAAALQLAEAKVQVETSKTQEAVTSLDCARFEQLHAAGAIPQMEYDQAMGRCKTAPLAVEAAQLRASIASKNVGDGIIRAPFSGVVADRLVSVGEYVQPATRVVSLAAVDTLKLEFSVPEANYPAVKQGTAVRFQVVAYGNRSFDGRILHVGGAVRSTRDVLVEAEVSNPDGVLLPGMFATVSLPVGSQQLPVVPPSAVFDRLEKKNVFVVENGILSQRVLQLEEQRDGLIPVVRGLQAGERIVTAVRPELKNGDSVQ